MSATTSSAGSVLWWLPAIVLICIALFLAVELFRSGRGVGFSRSIWFVASGIYTALGVIAIAAPFSFLIGLFDILIVYIFGVPVPSFQIAGSVTVLWELGAAAIAGAILSVYALKKIKAGLCGWATALQGLSVLGLIFTIIRLSAAPCLINCPVVNNGFNLNFGGSPLSLGIAQIAFSVVLGLSAVILRRSRETA